MALSRSLVRALATAKRSTLRHIATMLTWKMVYLKASALKMLASHIFVHGQVSSSASPCQSLFHLGLRSCSARQSGRRYLSMQESLKARPSNSSLETFIGPGWIALSKKIHQEDPVELVALISPYYKRCIFSQDDSSQTRKSLELLRAQKPKQENYIDYYKN